MMYKIIWELNNTKIVPVPTKGSEQIQGSLQQLAYNIWVAQLPHFVDHKFSIQVYLDKMLEDNLILKGNGVYDNTTVNNYKYNNINQSIGCLYGQLEAELNKAIIPLTNKEFHLLESNTCSEAQKLLCVVKAIRNAFAHGPYTPIWNFINKDGTINKFSNRDFEIKYGNDVIIALLKDKHGTIVSYDNFGKHKDFFSIVKMSLEIIEKYEKTGIKS